MALFFKAGRKCRGNVAIFCQGWWLEVFQGVEDVKLKRQFAAQNLGLPKKGRKETGSSSNHPGTKVSGSVSKNFGSFSSSVLASPDYHPSVPEAPRPASLADVHSNQTNKSWFSVEQRWKFTQGIRKYDQPKLHALTVVIREKSSNLPATFAIKFDPLSVSKLHRLKHPPEIPPGDANHFFCCLQTQRLPQEVMRELPATRDFPTLLRLQLGISTSTKSVGKTASRTIKKGDLQKMNQFNLAPCKKGGQRNNHFVQDGNDEVGEA